jgi:purine-nucleoside phosphorylase
MTGMNPLIGPNVEEWGPRFPDMSSAYDPGLVRFAEQAAAELNITLRQGVYAGITGPAYMTPAELRMLRILGADAVGMSTVPEVISARHMGMRVLGISCITDMAIAETLKALTHEQVVAVANRTKPTFKRLMKKLVSEVVL